MTSPEPIAIVGIGCRLPGGVVDPRSLWQLLRDGRDAITSIPTGRFDLDGLYDERAATPGHIMSQWGGFVDGIDGFDAGFFETAPRQAERLDPQQRLLLETAWEALEDAGVPRESIARTNAGVYVGMWTNEYESRMFADRDRIDFHMTTGTGRYAASGRLSYFFDLLGPSVTIDTACSSSLVAVHLAAQGLRNGECDLALAGGVNLIVEPFITIAYSQSRMMAPDGRCKFGDASANGYVRSDGAVMIALKRLTTAQAAGDHIYAVVRGSSVTNDGRTSGLLGRPGQAGQEEMLRRGYGHAGVDPPVCSTSRRTARAPRRATPSSSRRSLQWWGPAAMRPTSASSGRSSRTSATPRARRVLPVWSNWRSRSSTARFPPRSTSRNRTPTSRGAISAFESLARHQPWPAVDGPRRGGVSAYGIAGTNAHVVLEQAPPAAAGPIEQRPPNTHLLAISASSPAGLRGARRALRRHARDRYQPDRRPVRSGGHTPQPRDGSPDGRRLDVGGAGPRNWRRKLSDRDARPAEAITPATNTWSSCSPGRGRSGRAWPAGCWPTSRYSPQRWPSCDAAIRAEAGWSPLEMLTAADAVAADRPRSTWCSRCCSPFKSRLPRCGARGHQARRGGRAQHGRGGGRARGRRAAPRRRAAVICRRSRLLRRVSGQGAMALVDLPLAEAAAAIAGHEAQLSVAVSNSPRSTVLSGDPAVLRSCSRPRGRDVFCRPVNVDVASHSPQVDPLLDELRAALADLAPGPTSVPFHSTVRGRVVDGAALDAGYWAANLRQPVLFGDATRELARRWADDASRAQPAPDPAAGDRAGACSDVERPCAALAVDAPRRAGAARCSPGSARCTKRALPSTGDGTVYAAGATSACRAIPGSASVSGTTRPAARCSRRGGHPLLGHARGRRPSPGPALADHARGRRPRVPAPITSCRAGRPARRPASSSSRSRPPRRGSARARTTSRCRSAAGRRRCTRVRCRSLEPIRGRRHAASVLFAGITRRHRVAAARRAARWIAPSRPLAARRLDTIRARCTERDRRRRARATMRGRELDYGPAFQARSGHGQGEASGDRWHASPRGSASTRIAAARRLVADRRSQRCRRRRPGRRSFPSARAAGAPRIAADPAVGSCASVSGPDRSTYDLRSVDSAVRTRWPRSWAAAAARGSS